MTIRTPQSASSCTASGSAPTTPGLYPPQPTMDDMAWKAAVERAAAAVFEASPTVGALNARKDPTTLRLDPVPPTRAESVDRLVRSLNPLPNGK